MRKTTDKLPKLTKLPKLAKQTAKKSKFTTLINQHITRERTKQLNNQTYEIIKELTKANK